MAQKQLTYPSVNALMKYLPVQKRILLAQSVPAVRTLQKVTPLRLEQLKIKVEYFEYYAIGEVQLDTVHYRIEAMNSDSEATVTSSLTGKSIRVPAFCLLRQIYERFARNATVKNIVVENLDLIGILFYSNIHVRHVKVKLEANSRAVQLTKASGLQPINTLEIDNQLSEAEEILNNLKSLDVTDSLKICTVAVSDSTLIGFKNMECVEEETNVEKLRKFCQKLKNESELGTSYSGYLYATPQVFHAFFEELKTEMNGVDSYLNGRKCLTIKTSKEENELNITFVQKFNPQVQMCYYISAKVMYSQTSKPRGNLIVSEKFYLFLNNLYLLWITWCSTTAFQSVDYLVTNPPNVLTVIQYLLMFVNCAQGALFFKLGVLNIPLFIVGLLVVCFGWMTFMEVLNDVAEYCVTMNMVGQLHASTINAILIAYGLTFIIFFSGFFTFTSVSHLIMLFVF